MGTYFAAVFSDLERHSLVWNRIPRDRTVAVIGEYRYVAESRASQYGCLHLNFTGDGHLFLYENADSAVQFSLGLIESWKKSTHSAAAVDGLPHIPLRLGCHFGECTKLDGDAWIGRAINLAKRVEDAAESDTLFVTENILELVDLPLYAYQEAGRHELKGDHLPRRTLYRVTALDESALASKPTEELSAEAWFLKAVALKGTEEVNTELEADYYRQALRLRPEYPEVHNNLAIVLRAIGDRDGAAKHYRETLRLRPEYPEAHYNYAILLESQGRVSGSMAFHIFPCVSAAISGNAPNWMAMPGSAGPSTWRNGSRTRPNPTRFS